MRVAIDCTTAITEDAGIGRYVRGLVAALAQTAPLDKADSLTLFSSETPSQLRPLPSNAYTRPLVRPIGHRNLTRLWHKFHVPLPAEVLLGRVDVFHSPDFNLPPTWRAKRIVTIHDLAYLKYPEYAQPGIVDYLAGVVPRALRAADHVIAISKTTANDLVECYAVPRERISVIYPGRDLQFSPKRDEVAQRNVRQRYELEQPFLLAVSTIEPRKNYVRLVEAFAAATQQPNGPQLLVIVGRKGWHYDDVFAAIERHKLTNQIRFLGYVPDEALAQLYQMSIALVMPSLYEGFGMPIIEAMASGTPVICSTGGSLPEVADDAALLVAPDDTAALTDAILQLTNDVELRRDLNERGLLRVQQFSWEAAAQAHLHLYHRVVDGA